MNLDPSRARAPPRNETPAAAAVLAGLIAAHRVVLVRAPAGYGKTTLLADACQRMRMRGARTAWLDPRHFDGDAAALAQHLDGLLSRAAGTQWPLHLCIDGLDAWQHMPAAALLARRIDVSLREGGPAVHWVLASRGRPCLPLARWRAEGQLAEWGVRELRPDAQACAALLAREAGQQLAPAQTDAALRLAEGWPVALRLLGRRLASQPSTEFAEDCPSDIGDYFRDEVWASLDAELQVWLPAVGVLPRLTAALCDAVTGRNDSHALIARLDDAGGFIESLDDAGRAWRLHPLFAAFVSRALEADPQRLAQVHRRASRWSAVQGRTDDALNHAQRSGDAGFLAETLDRCWDSVNRAGSFSRMIRLAQGLPRALLLQWPRVLLWQALYLMVERRFEEAERLLGEVDRRLERQPPAGDEEVELRYTLVHRRMSLALFRDDADACEQHHRSLQALGPSPDPYLQGLAQLAEVGIGRQRWRLADCEAPAFASQALFMDLGHAPGLVWHACAVGPLLMQRGQVQGAAVHYRRAVIETAALPCGDPADELASMPLALLAEAQLEQGDLDAARETFARALHSARPIGPLDASAALLLGRARLAFHDSDTATAHAMLEQAQAMARARSFERLRWAVLHERVRQLLARGDIDGARTAAREAGLPEATAALMPQADTSLAREQQALTWVRLALAAGQSAAALRLARAWAQFGAERGAVATAVRAGLLHASALHASGQPRAAQRAVAHALVLAGDGGMVFTFVEEQEPVLSLLHAALDAAPAGLRSHLRELLQPRPSGPTGDTTPAEALNAREVDVLRQAARGLLYKEIGDRLGLTEGSVKWYMQQIYAKLGVRRRLPAIQKGSLLGYL